MHYPKTPEEQAELAKRVATIHAQAVITKIDHLACPTEQKIHLIEELQRMAKKAQ